MSDYTIIKSLQIEDEFNGFDDGMLFKLSDGSFWIQTQYKYWYHYAYRPEINILKGYNHFALQVVGQNEIVQVEEIHNVIESKINGAFKGWNGETEYELTNGQVWKQSKYKYKYKYKYRPNALIYKINGSYCMKVENTTANVRRIK